MPGVMEHGLFVGLADVLVIGSGGAGTAAALALHRKTTPRGVYKAHLNELHQLLLKHDQFVPGVINRDPADLALADEPGYAALRARADAARELFEDLHFWAPLQARGVEVDFLLRGEVFVDLHRVVRQGVLAAVERYSLKELEPYCGFERELELEEARRALASVSLWSSRSSEIRPWLRRGRRRASSRTASWALRHTSSARASRSWRSPRSSSISSCRTWARPISLLITCRRRSSDSRVASPGSCSRSRSASSA